MTRVLAAVAGALAAAGIFELAGVLVANAHSRPRRSPRGASRMALAALRRVGRGLRPAREPQDLQARLDAAGLEVSVPDFLAAKIACAIASLFTCVPLAPGLPGRLPMAAVVAAPVAAFLLPDAWLRRRTRARAGAMEAELADVLDLLRVAVSAGLPAHRALEEVGRRHPGSLARELRRTAGELDLGVPSPSAYARLAQRAPLRGARALVAALTRATSHGAPLAGTLDALAAEARASQARRVAERAARAAPKIQLVVALLLVPSVLLLVAAALLPSLLD